ncbi:hypothetical protein [Actinoplanes sp. NPDC051411]|uniref:hypothetical protein n=1 Tax=Actinoplanes sp. NPDC051411 TaxID=3155522 RepID=UPI0034327980
MNGPGEPEQARPSPGPADELLAEAGVDDPRVAALLARAAAPDSARAHHGEQAALAAFRQARDTRVRRTRARASLIAAALAVTLIGLLSFAALGDRHPQDPSPDGDSGPISTATAPAGRPAGSAPVFDGACPCPPSGPSGSSPRLSPTATPSLSESPAPPANGNSAKTHGKSAVKSHPAKAHSTPPGKASSHSPGNSRKH